MVAIMEPTITRSAPRGFGPVSSSAAIGMDGDVFGTGPMPVLALPQAADERTPAPRRRSTFKARSQRGLVVAASCSLGGVVALQTAALLLIA